MATCAGLNAQVLGISVDHVPCLQSWAESLGGINYPLLSDFWPHGEVAKQYGVLRDEGYTERAIFVLDTEGVIQYIDIHDIANQPSNEIVFDEIRRFDPEAAANEPKAPLLSELPRGGIVMYCTAWCPDCLRTRLWLDEHGVEYTEVNVNAVPGAAAQVREWAEGKLITPTFDVDGSIVLNPDEDKLAEMFA
jgi:glutaredoxin